jgi:hypothetical protein
MRRSTKRSRTSLANGKQLATVDGHFHHSVYVILLDSSVLRHPSILRLNPNRQLTWVVKKYGLRLMPELYGFLNPMPNGKGFGRGSASGWLYRHRRYIGDDSVKVPIEEDPPGRGEQHWKRSCSSSLPFMHAFFQAFVRLPTTASPLSAQRPFHLAIEPRSKIAGAHP